MAEPGEETAGTLMTSPAVIVQPDMTVSEAAWHVALSCLKRVSVVETDGRLVETAHRHALLDALLEVDATLGEGVRGRIRHVLSEAADTVEATVQRGPARLRGSVTSDEGARLLAEVKGFDPVGDVIDEPTVRDG
ncbi:CBS domain-containing protein [Streptomyces sp. NPDC004520]|uniref:CBS domain-containing protein n=1 Tax=Streptomyces sp. NPDC004520 TaxID=3364702 RepID=UPI003688507F